MMIGSKKYKFIKRKYDHPMKDMQNDKKRNMMIGFRNARK